MGHTGGVALTESARRVVGLPITFLVTGAIGLVASLALTLDKIALLENPNAQLSCNFSVLVGCSDNLNSAQGSVFGFPNPILGLVFWSAVITVGVGMLAGARFNGWFWVLFSIGTAAALALVIWFIVQSIFVLRVLCPWCMVTWSVTIPVFFVVVLHTLRSEWVPASIRKVASAGFFWIPIATLLCYVIIAVLAQAQLDVLSEFF